MGNLIHSGWTAVGRFLVLGAIAVGIATVLIGCQMAPTVSVRRLVEHREAMDQSGLRLATLISELKVSWAVPSRWESLPLKKTGLYSHQQWRSPTLLTGVGVAHVQMPLPIPAQAIVWFAKNEYLKKSKDQKDGKLIGQWTDALGRLWFEAENSKYHVKGYAITRGTEAWIVYTGWRMSQQPQSHEIALAQRSVESIVPAN